jgi:hypothetical protein
MAKSYSLHLSNAINTTQTYILTAYEDSVSTYSKYC